MKIHKALNILLIVVLLLTGFSASPNLISAQGPDEESLDQANTFSVLAGLGAESQGVTQIEGSLGIAAEGAEAPGDWQVGGEIHVKTMIVYTLFEVIVYTFYRSNRFPSILGSPWIK